MRHRYKKGDLVKWIGSNRDWHRDLGIVLDGADPKGPITTFGGDLNIYTVYWIKEKKANPVHSMYFALANEDNDEEV